jgi:hypothetical protein
MLSSITKKVTAYIAKVTLKGTHHVARAKERKRQNEEADRAAARAEEEWWQEIRDRVAEERRQRFRRDNELWGRGVLLYEEIMQSQDMELRQLEEDIEQENLNLQDGPQDEWEDMSDRTESHISVYAWSDLSEYTFSEMQDEVQDDADDELRDGLDDSSDGRQLFQLQDGLIYELHDELVNEFGDELPGNVEDAPHGDVQDDPQYEVRDNVQSDVEDGAEGNVQATAQEQGMLQFIPSDPEEEFSVLSIPLSPLQALEREACIAGLGQEHGHTDTPLSE